MQKTYLLNVLGVSRSVDVENGEAIEGSDRTTITLAEELELGNHALFLANWGEAITGWLMSKEKLADGTFEYLLINPQRQRITEDRLAELREALNTKVHRVELERTEGAVS